MCAGCADPTDAGGGPVPTGMARIGAGIGITGAGATTIGTATIGDLMREVTTRYLP